MKWLFAAVLAIAVGMALRPSPRANAEPASAPTTALDLVVERQGGPPVELRFEVAAPDAAGAEAAARAAVPELVPGGVIAGGGVTAQWAQWGWAWSDAELPVRVAYNPIGAPDFVAPDAIVSALRTWSSVPSSRFAFEYGGITDHTASLSASGPDGENVIAWQSLDCSQACVLGVTTREATHESDLILNSNPAAKLANGAAAGMMDSRTVILHETGHMAGLEHSCPAPFGPCTDAETDAVMYYAYRGVKRALAPDDIAGISAIYPARPPAGTATPPAPGAMPVSLEPGWNLVTLPTGPLALTMASLNCALAVYHFDGSAWEVWARGALPALNTLDSADASLGYWVQAGGPCGQTFAGP